jgi:hypothetical protein
LIRLAGMAARHGGKDGKRPPSGFVIPSEVEDLLFPFDTQTR